MALIGNCALIIAPAGAQDLENNRQFTEKLFHQIAQRAVRPLDSLPHAPVAIAHRSVAQETIDRLLYRKLIEVLQNEKARKVFASAETPASAVRLDYKIAAFELTYRKLPAGWFRSAKIRREASARVDFDFQLPGSGAVFFQGVIAGTQADTLRAAQVARSETPELPFTVGKWEEQSGRRKVWEPMLLAAATGAIVYAFYSLRSH